MDKEIKIVPPEGYKIDEENSTFECIKFKPIIKRWRDNEEATMEGFYITSSTSRIEHSLVSINTPENYNTFATKKTS